MKNKKIGICIIISVLFIINTILVMMNKVEGIDTLIRDGVFSFYGEVMDKVMKFFTFLGSTIFVIGFTLVVVAILVFKKKRSTGLSMAAILVTSTVLNNLIKIIIRRERPLYMVINENTFSYPSGHMMAATTVYGFLIFLVLKSKFPKKYKVLYTIFLSLVILLVGTSRIYFGAHFFTDIYGAFLLSTLLINILSIINDKKGLL